MMDRLFSPLAFAGPFRGSGIGVCRTFLELTIGVCRTFFPEGLPVDGFAKPRTGTRFSAYKAFVFTKRLFSKEGSGLRPACLIDFRYDERGGLQEQSARAIQLERKKGRADGDGPDGVRVGPPRGRRAVASHGGRQQGSGARSATVDSAWESRGRCHAARGRASRLRRDRRVSDTLAFVPHDRRGYHPSVAASYRRPATPCPHYAGPAA